jgi:hypothetical protein
MIETQLVTYHRFQVFKSIVISSGNLTIWSFQDAGRSTTPRFWIER